MRCGVARTSTEHRSEAEEPTETAQAQPNVLAVGMGPFVTEMVPDEAGETVSMSETPCRVTHTSTGGIDN